MNIRDLEYLIALSEFKHFRKAADACNVSQPTLSGQIRKLEDELGAVLLERTSRKVLFTQAGLTLVEQAKSVLREVKILKEMASNQGKDMSGPILIGVIPTLGPYISPIILPNLQSLFPELEIYIYELQTNELLEHLESGQLDCGILSLSKETEPFIEVPIFNEKMLLAVSTQHSWAKEEQLDLARLRDKEMLMLDNGHCLRTQTMDYCLSIGAKENRHFKANSLETLRNMVAANIGIALMPELATRNLAIPSLKYIPFADPEPFRSIGLVYRPGSPLRLRYERLAKEIEKIIAGCE
ncbi:DNA-binding transcriptional regulator OxyR [Ursidibacter maritimus]|uniref:DNA-binding transcriptional regulator OxyR n=1 Tax=Ursidibacter maritimus TaxID=1331689 RepID=A0A949WG19_9PAST|nr:DNA-binding transcriptional regulator OxyR [Ursidibacter maritimus]KAE9540157.1 DNA-binding transcriptional regulator OxyR [Ursidibacter maritimus]MBV6523795.1 DNA-binding transcriptional regulator OxyR [Ursidibacter maritimus]MBV6526305.1 DNA-binding transcriptional regulator OxyR [Ursidibacter maritimus]MBV6527849.1 DNA-binding transcriptional regulator OxyR [Ursidibacter maritimus]MBV6529198.1 DNA-binding transcriptional regulator OxyR [Ursidibacter maritimus]